MKKLIFILSMLLVGCEHKPSLQAGVCYHTPRDREICERWKESCPHYVQVVLEVGVQQYHTLYTDANQGLGGGYTKYDEIIHHVDMLFTDGYYEKTECPQVLKDQYAKSRAK